MPPDLIVLFLLAGALSAVTIATIMYVGFPCPETRFTLVVTLLWGSAKKRGIFQMGQHVFAQPRGSRL